MCVDPRSSCPSRWLFALAAAALLAGAAAARGDDGPERYPTASVKPKVAAASPTAYYAGDPAPDYFSRWEYGPGGWNRGYEIAAAPRRAARATASRGYRSAGRSILRHQPIDEANPEATERAPIDVPSDRPPAARPGAGAAPEEIPPGRPVPVPGAAPYDGPWPPTPRAFADEGPSFAHSWSHDELEEPIWDDAPPAPWDEPARGDGDCEFDCDEFGYVRPEDSWFRENLSLLVGTHGFKSPVDRDVDGNFGFHEGINWGLPFWDRFGIGAQAGVQLLHSDLAGGETFDDSRTQTFLTVGLFHRPLTCRGWQGGVAFDYLHDDFNVAMDLAQLRAELSYMLGPQQELGFWTAQQLNGDSAELTPNNPIEWEVLDQYALFYRHHFRCGNSARLWGGFTGEGDGLVGGDASVVLAGRWSLQAGFNARVPGETDGPEDFNHEAWGLTLNLVWTPGRDNPRSFTNPYRPLFNVAGNETMMLQIAE